MEKYKSIEEIREFTKLLAWLKTQKAQYEKQGLVPTLDLLIEELEEETLCICPKCGQEAPGINCNPITGWCEGCSNEKEETNCIY